MRVMGTFEGNQESIQGNFQKYVSELSFQRMRGWSQKIRAPQQAHEVAAGGRTW